MEAWYAHRSGKYVVAYTGGLPPHPWTVYVADAVHADLAEAVAALQARTVRRKAVVVGAGAMGAAAARALAERGWAVSLIEQHAIGHDLGASGHATRSFRLSHTEADDVRLAVRALELWNDLERRSGETLPATQRPAPARLRRAPDGQGTARGGRAATTSSTTATSRACSPRCGPARRARRSSSPTAPSSWRAARSSCRCGSPALRAPSCTRARSASPSPPQGDGVRVFTRRRRLDADVAVVCAGPWSLPLLAPLGLNLPLTAGLAQVTSFRSLHDGWESRPGLMERTHGAGVYGMPEHGRGFKLGWATINPMTFWKESKVRPYDRDEQALVERVREDFPGFDPTPLRHEAGPITLVPDEHFVIDRKGPVVVGAACIGHAFKFSPLLGELFADLAEQKPLPPEARRFRLDRPTLAPERRSGRVAIGA